MFLFLYIINVTLYHTKEIKVTKTWDFPQGTRKALSSQLILRAYLLN